MVNIVSPSQLQALPSQHTHTQPNTLTATTLTQNSATYFIQNHSLKRQLHRHRKQVGLLWVLVYTPLHSLPPYNIIVHNGLSLMYMYLTHPFENHLPMLMNYNTYGRASLQRKLELRVGNPWAPHPLYETLKLNKFNASCTVHQQRLIEKFRHKYNTL